MSHLSLVPWLLPRLNKSGCLILTSPLPPPPPPLPLSLFRIAYFLTCEKSSQGFRDSQSIVHLQHSSTPRHSALLLYLKLLLSSLRLLSPSSLCLVVSAPRLHLLQGEHGEGGEEFPGRDSVPSSLLVPCTFVREQHVRGGGDTAGDEASKLERFLLDRPDDCQRCLSSQSGG
eukprot:749516-Hanusia_phi.AAC.3